MLRTEVWIATTLIATGIIGGLLFNWPRSANDSNRDSPPPTQASDPLAPTSGGPDPDNWKSLIPAAAPQPPENETRVPTDRIQEGDRYLSVGNYPASLRSYRSTINQLGGQATPWLLIRVAYATEMENDLSDAEALYRATVQASEQNLQTRLLGLAGLGRTWRQLDRMDESIGILTELFLRYGSDKKIPEEVRLEITYQLTNSLQQKLLDRQQASVEDPDRESNFRFHWAKPQVERWLELENMPPIQLANEVANGDETGSPIEVIQRPSLDANLIALDGESKLVSLSDLLDLIATKAELTIGMTERAHESILGRSARLNLNGLSLALILDSLFAPLNLAWNQEAGHISVRHASEAEPDELLENDFEHADRMLRQVELNFPPGERRSSSLMHRGILSLNRGDFAAARKRFNELEKLEPNGELAAQLAFNRGQLELTSGKRTEAIERLYFAVDQSLDQDLQASSYAMISQLELENGHANRAIYAASRGLALTADPVHKEKVLMTLAKAYLLESDPFSANKVLFEHARSLAEAPSERLAAVLGAYSRFLGTQPVDGLRNEGERLVVALAALEPDDVNNFVDELLVGRAFFEVGFANRSKEMLERAREHSKHEFWRRRIAYELAVHHHRTGELTSAATIYSEVCQSLRDQVGVLAQLKLAELKLTQKEPDNCLQLCQELWQLSLEDDQKSKTLVFMGQAYQQLGRHHAAAVCFSGMVPEFDGDLLMQSLEPSNPLSGPGDEETAREN